MNKELINNYKAEFDHWLNGGKVILLDRTQTYVVQEDSTWNFNEGYTPIINDEYVEFRKALAEGKTIQGNKREPGMAEDWQDIRADKEGVLKAYLPSALRIKPYEPKFKVGDWVYPNKNRIPQKIAYIDADIVDCGHESLRYYESTCELWKPKPGEWVVHTVTEESFQVGLYVGMENEMHSIEGNSYLVDHIEPYLGTLPTHLQDK